MQLANGGTSAGLTMTYTVSRIFGTAAAPCNRRRSAGTRPSAPG